MAIDPAAATAAYQNAVKRVTASLDRTGAEPPEDRDVRPSTFMDMVKSTAEQTIDANRAAEALSLKAVTGEAELSEVATAVANAETALQTMVTVRDRIISAYQEIMRMPI